MVRWQQQLLRTPCLWFLAATGTGKSQVISCPNIKVFRLTKVELAVDLATRFNGEIINGDAMQMYGGLPIITNKITVEEQQGIPHHLLGFIALDEEPWRVGMFRGKRARS